MESNNLQLLVQSGAIGLALALIGLIYYIIKYFKDREAKDRDILTNHLSSIIKDDTESRNKLTEVLTRQTETLNHFCQSCDETQKDFRETQSDFKNEVIRFKTLRNK